MRESGSSSSDCAISPTYDVRTLDYNHAPFLVIWEVTQACDLACVHCRASARPRRDPGEITLAEARKIFAQIRRMGTRLLVLTGGDPLKRPDIFELIAAAREVGLNPSLSPSATPLLTRESLAKGRQAGLTAVSLSLDGASATSHDDFRGVAGSFDRTLEMATEIRNTGLELRINTVVTRRNVDEMPAIARLVAASGARIWSVFFLVPTGRAEASMQITPERCEELLRWLYELSKTAPYRVKTTEAPHYRRIVLEMMANESGRSISEILAASKSAKGRFMPGMNDARGFVFISHMGDVFPSGFFPLSAGNVRQTELSLIYRDSVLFRNLRDPFLLDGRCGKCRYRSLCGGSRARAWAATGDPVGEDPLCAYHPGVEAV